MRTAPAPSPGSGSRSSTTRTRGGLPRASSTCGRIVAGTGPSGPPPGGPGEPLGQLGRPLAADPLDVAREQPVLEVRRRAGRLLVPDAGATVVEPAPAPGLQRQREVDVLVVGGVEALVEAADLVVGGAAEQQRVGRGEVDLPPEGPGAAAGREAPADGRGAAVVEQDGAGLLHAAVREEDPAADRGGVRVLVQRLDQRLEPAGLDRRVVVEQEQQLAAGLAGQPVVAAAEAEVDRADEHARAADLALGEGHDVGLGAVAEQQHLRRDVRGQVLGEGGQAPLQQPGVLLREDQHRDARLGAGAQADHPTDPRASPPAARARLGVSGPCTRRADARPPAPGTARPAARTSSRRARASS